MPKLPPRLCPKHARGEREDDPGGIGMRPPTGSSACSMCRREAAEAQQAPLARMTAGTRTFEHRVSADEPDDDYPVQSERVREYLSSRREFEREESDRVAPAVAKLDNERPTLMELDHARPGRERQRAYDRHMRVLHGGSRRRASDEVIVDVHDGSDFDAAMKAGQEARERIIAGIQTTGDAA
jgi:hypothetical protein